MTGVPLEKQIRMYHGQRVVILTHVYEADGKGPHGYYYHYEGETTQHWISNGAAAIRFTKEPPAPLPAKDRRGLTIAAAVQGIMATAPLIGAVSVVETPKGFCVVYGNDERMYFDAVEI